MAEFDQITLETAGLVQGHKQNKEIDRKHGDRAAELSCDAPRPERHGHLIWQPPYNGLSPRDQCRSVAMNR
ncbi:hypothetical protein [Devosia sp. FKR38]|uniref:hypothetical protein n=1 Tax=Devosia sp. FKR38 TaxID=2562312 RepID=UPI0010C0A7B6|nr:hypothetical protein [Devosia sp. FKR38]